MFKRFLLAAMAGGAAMLGSADAAAIQVGYAGIGGQIGLVIPDNHHHYDHVFEIEYNDVDIGFHMAMHGKIGFDLSRYGMVYYYPSAGVWFGCDHSGNQDFSVGEIMLNIFDLAYGFPVPLVVKPYVGLGPTILIDVEHVEPDPLGEEDSDTDADVGFNLFAGCDFEASSSLRPFVEIRGKFGDWDTFKLVGGLTFSIGGQY